MARIISNRPVENDSEQAVLDTLSQSLPEDYIIVPNVQVARVPEIDLVIIRRDIIITAEVKGWYNTIKGEPFAGSVQVGPKSWPNPVLQAQKQMQELVRFLKRKEQARLIFDDPRVANTMYIRPVVIFSNPRADIQLPSTERVLVMSLAEAAKKLKDPNLKRYACDLLPVERERIASLLLNRPVEPKQLPTLQTIEDVPTETACTPAVKPAAEPLSRFICPAEEPVTASTSDTWLDDHHSETNIKLPNGRMLFGTVLKFLDDIEQMRFRNGKDFGKATIRQSELAHALETELEDGLYHLLYETLACNHFLIHLSGSDYERALVFKDKGENELSHHISKVIQARDYRTKGAVRVEFVLDDTLDVGNYRLTSDIDETIENVESESDDSVIATDGPYLKHLPSGEVFPLNKQKLTIGRSKQNTICVGALGGKTIVSRKHAVLCREPDGWVIYDGVEGKPSSYGTYVNGEKLIFGAGCLLRDGQRIILGPPQRANPLEPLQGSLLFTFHEAN